MDKNPYILQQLALCRGLFGDYANAFADIDKAVNSKPYEILIQNDTSSMTQMIEIGDSSFIGETIKYAVIIVSVVPILCIYPFIQKYFEKGVMIGAVKG